MSNLTNPPSLSSSKACLRTSNLGQPYEVDYFLPVFQLMETQQQACGKALHSFMNTLLNYRANTSTTDVRIVQSQLEMWSSIVDEKEQTEEHMRQVYIEQHDAPRTEAKQKYEQFLRAKDDLYYQWLRTKNHGDLFQWLEMEYKEDTTPLSDMVYTKYTKTSTP